MRRRTFLGGVKAMKIHEFPTVYSVLEQNGLVDETADKFYAGAVALPRVRPAGL
jgi:hypothetical protein